MIYGDAANPRLLDQVGAVGTRVVVVAVDRPDRAEAAVSAARAAYPQALVLARAHDDDRRPKLERLGASVVLTETLELGLGLAEAAMRRLEVPEEVAREALTSGRTRTPRTRQADFRSRSQTLPWSLHVSLACCRQAAGLGLVGLGGGVADHPDRVASPMIRPLRSTTVAVPCSMARC